MSASTPRIEFADSGDVVFTVAQVASMLGLDRLTLLRMRKRGDGPVFVRLSPNRIGYTARDIREFLASRRQKQLRARDEQPSDQGAADADRVATRAMRTAAA
jgi:predicted DNA-binding transcriptional regulator AlpA